MSGCRAQLDTLQTPTRSLGPLSPAEVSPRRRSTKPQRVICVCARVGDGKTIVTGSMKLVPHSIWNGCSDSFSKSLATQHSSSNGTRCCSKTGSLTGRARGVFTLATHRYDCPLSSPGVLGRRVECERDAVRWEALDYQGLTARVGPMPRVAYSSRRQSRLSNPTQAPLGREAWLFFFGGGRVMRRRKLLRL